MKLILSIGAGLGLLVALLAGGSQLLPKSAVVEQSVYLEATPEQVFPLLNNPTNWKKWNAWNKTYDPSMIEMYGGPEYGIGAKQSWNGDKTGNWRMLFVLSSAPDTLQYELVKEGDTTRSEGTLTLQATGQGTTLTWHQHTPVIDKPLDLYLAAWQNYKTEQHISQGLANLQLLVNNNRNQTAKK